MIKGYHHDLIHFVRYSIAKHTYKQCDYSSSSPLLPPDHLTPREFLATRSEDVSVLLTATALVFWCSRIQPLHRLVTTRTPTTRIGSILFSSQIANGSRCT